MKNRIILLVVSLLMSAGIYAAAQVCKIGGGDSVEVFNCYFSNDSKNEVTVVVSNDSNDKSANITVTIEVTYTGGIKKTYSGKALAAPSASTDIKIPVSTQWTAKSVEVVSISGAKCSEN